jgi:O-antigen/teichoic acid export membrane protein
VTPLPARDPIWDGDGDQLLTVARNVGTRYLVIATDAAIGLLLLPFNVHYLGQSMWGLWMLTASLNTYFSILDMGYGGSITRFVALYRARRDVRALNELLSTFFVVFTAVGVVAYGVFALVASHVSLVFNLTPDQVETARNLLLISGLYIAMGFPFGVFGGVMNGFQRYDINNIVGMGTTIAVAIVNVAMLMSGASLVQMFATTTSIRMGAYFVYRRNAYRIFPALTVRFSSFRWARVREVTGFSVYVAIINWSHRLNYTAGTLIIGAFLNPAAVALWTVPRRMAEFVQRLTNQLNGVLLPVVVDSAARRKADRLRTIFLQGTRLSLFGVVPLATTLFLLADRLIPAWVGSTFQGSVPIAQILAGVIALRVGNATANTILKGAERHRLLAFTNLAIAVANVGLSLLWIRSHGLVGQALAMLLPVAAASVFVLWPAACRRVEIGVGEAFRLAVWPALWPAIPMVLLVVALRAALPAGIPGVVFTGTAGLLCYGATFLLFAVKGEERTTYLAQARHLARRSRGVAAAA